MAGFGFGNVGAKFIETLVNLIVKKLKRFVITFKFENKTQQIEKMHTDVYISYLFCPCTCVDSMVIEKH
jgi:hypothetical protein